MKDLKQNSQTTLEEKAEMTKFKCAEQIIEDKGHCVGIECNDCCIDVSKRPVSGDVIEKRLALAEKYVAENNPEPVEVKYCADCEWCKEEYFCSRPVRNMVSKKTQESLDCWVLRSSEAYCGASAKWFEPKEEEVNMADDWHGKEDPIYEKLYYKEDLDNYGKCEPECPYAECQVGSGACQHCSNNKGYTNKYVLCSFESDNTKKENKPIRTKDFPSVEDLRDCITQHKDSANMLLDKVCNLIADEFLRCSNNGKGGLCVECRENAIKFLDECGSLLKEKIMEEKDFIGCGDHSCLLEKPNGTGTNGGCRCLRDIEHNLRWKIMKALQRRDIEIKELRENNTDHIGGYQPIDDGIGEPKGPPKEL